MKNIVLSVLFFLFVLVSSLLPVSAESSSVLVVELQGTINQSSVEMLRESIQEAELNNAQAILLLLDTPGGGLDQTFEIADLINKSRIPVIGFVFPSGATAWSAGTFILMSTHLAAMAEYTVIGSCQPIETTLEGTRFINDSKIINALVTWIQERALMYGRNQTVVKEFVTINRNVNASSAKTLGVVESVSSSVVQLLRDIDGKNVTTREGIVTLDTVDAQQRIYTPSLKIQIMRFLSNPILTSLLLMLGIFALITGISTPGYGAEVFGVVAILLSLIGSGFTIPTLSIIFIIIGCLLLIVEVFVIPGFGVVGIGGIICLIFGSIFLIPSYSTQRWLISREYMSEAILILGVVVALIAVFFGFLLYKIVQIRKKKPSMGEFIGETAVAIDQITPEKKGFVRFNGEYWSAKSDYVIEPNTKVVIVGKDQSTLLVKPLET